MELEILSIVPAIPCAALDAIGTEGFVAGIDSSIEMLQNDGGERQ
jgi:hypothetical protein